MRWFSKRNATFRKKARNLIGFRPYNLELYRKAFRHLSVSKNIKYTNAKNSNERLEYLGDSILDMVVAELLFKKYPFKGEGYLTDIRSRLVSRKQLCDFAQYINLSDFLNVDSKVKANAHVMRSLGGNALEALIGAIYLDRGYKKSRQFVIKSLMDPFIDFKDIESLNINYKSIINQWAQKNKKILDFKLKEDKDEANDKKYTICLVLDGEELSSARHYSKKTAEKIASRMACKSLSLDY